MYIGLSKTPCWGYYDLSSSLQLTLGNFEFVLDLFGTTSGLCFDNTGLNVYISYYNDGLYKLNISTKQYNKLIAYCDSKSYGTISCSSDGRYLVGERINSTVNHDKGVIYQNYKINLIDLATLNETELLLE